MPSVPTLTVQSSAPLTMYCGPLLEGKQLFTNELWPFNFFILVPVSKSQIPKVLSVEAVNIVLKNKQHTRSQVLKVHRYMELIQQVHNYILLWISCQGRGYARQMQDTGLL